MPIFNNLGITKLYISIDKNKKCTFLTLKNALFNMDVLNVVAQLKICNKKSAYFETSFRQIYRCHKRTAPFSLTLSYMQTGSKSCQDETKSMQTQSGQTLKQGEPFFLYFMMHYFRMTIFGIRYLSLKNASSDRILVNK